MGKDKDQMKCNWKCGGKSGDAVYGLGLIGALIYFFSHAPSFGDKIMALLKSLVWPAMLVFKLLESLKV